MICPRLLECLEEGAMASWPGRLEVTVYIEGAIDVGTVRGRINQDSDAV